MAVTSKRAKRERIVPADERIAVRLKEVRELSGLSVAELDDLAGLGRGHTSMIECGKRTNLESSTARSIVKVFGITLDWLLSGVGQQPSRSAVIASVAKAKRLSA